MINFRQNSAILLATVGSFALAACGANDIASPGGGPITIITPTPPAPPPPPPPPVAAVTPASICPTIADPQGLTNDGTVKGPTGEYRVCTLPARFNVSSTLTKAPGVLYRLGGRVDVGTDQGAASTNTAITLTIAPGVIIYGGTGVSWLHVNRGNKISAVGTASRPIIFTSLNNVIGASDDTSIGQWGGVVLSGRAPVTDCTVAPAAVPGSVSCERQVEGALDPAVYGGASPADNSGQMSYVQIRYSGFILSGSRELQSLTTGGVGSGTVIDHIMSFNSSDDGAEFFGGRVNMKYFISVGADDDNLDTDVGLKANFQYVLVVQRPGAGDSSIEADSDNVNDGNIPRQNVKLSNFTFIQRRSVDNLTSILLRGGTDYTAVNGVIISPTETCVRISRPQTASAAVDGTIDEAGAPIFRSVVAQCATPAFVGLNGVTDAQVSTIFGSGANNNNSAYTPTLTALFINGATETAVPAFDAKTLDPYFDTTTYIGAVRDAADPWIRSWTCNSATADFGADNTGLCTSLPTY